MKSFGKIVTRLIFVGLILSTFSGRYWALKERDTVNEEVIILSHELKSDDLEVEVLGDLIKSMFKGIVKYEKTDSLSPELPKLREQYTEKRERYDSLRLSEKMKKREALDLRLKEARTYSTSLLIIGIMLMIILTVIEAYRLGRKDERTKKEK